jgi:hypothetical protein
VTLKFVTLANTSTAESAVYIGSSGIQCIDRVPDDACLLVALLKAHTEEKHQSVPPENGFTHLADLIASDAGGLN